MDRENLYQLHDRLTAEAKCLMRRKNRDYGENSDPFRNFRRWGLIGILVRMGDKLSRLETFVETGSLEVVEESVHDVVLDLINYSVLFKGYTIDANDRRGHDRMQEGQVNTRAVITGSPAGRAGAYQGGTGGFTGGGGGSRFATAVRGAVAKDTESSGGVKAGRSGSKHVGSKHRPGGKKG